MFGNIDKVFEKVCFWGVLKQLDNGGLDFVRAVAGAMLIRRPKTKFGALEEPRIRVVELVVNWRDQWGAKTNFLRRGLIGKSYCLPPITLTLGLFRVSGSGAGINLSADPDYN